MARTFVFEGADLVGKSTTAKMLAEQNSFRLERNVTVRDTYQLLLSVTDDIERARTRNICRGATTLFDRWQLVSDVIYNNYIFKKESKLEPYLTELYEQCKKSGVVFFVFLCNDKAELSERFAIRGDDERTLEEIIELQDAYKDFFTKGAGKNLNWLAIDTAGKKPEEVVNEVRSYIELLGGC